jgi:phage-related minor tail protein
MSGLIAISMAAVLIAFAVGWYTGETLTDHYWRSKAEPVYRTAIHSGGQFFYVVSEREFNDLQAKARIADQVDYVARRLVDTAA